MVLVSLANGKPALTATVSIYDGTKVVSYYPLFACERLCLRPGAAVAERWVHSLTAVYSGDANYAPGTSAVVPVTVSPGPVKLGLSCGNAKLKAGQTLARTVNANEGPLPVPGTVTYTVTG